MTKHDVEWRTQALQDCWQQQMTPLEFANYVGVTRAQVYAIFAGREWKSIPRPDGFVYPFPASDKRREQELLWQEDCLKDYVREKMTALQFSQHIGTNLAVAKRILRGDAWKAAPRPDGFLYPWPKS